MRASERLNDVVFSWVSSILASAKQAGRLDNDDLECILPRVLRPHYCWQQFKAAWARAPGREGAWKLVRSLTATCKVEMYLLLALKLLGDSLNFAAPLLLGRIVSCMTLEPSTAESLCGNRSEVDGAMHDSHAGDLPACALYAAALLSVALAKAFLGTLYTYRIQRLMIRVSTQLMTAPVYAALSQPLYKFRRFSEGHALSLVSVDAERTANLMQSVQELVSLPLQIVAALALLYMQVKLAFLAGLIMLLALIPINKFIAAAIGRATQKMMAQKDARLDVIAFLFSHLRSIFMLHWQHVIREQVEVHRAQELQQLAVRKYLDAVCVCSWALTSSLFAATTFGLMAVAREPLTASTVLVCLSLFSVLIAPFNALPWVINGVVDAVVSARRLSAFLSTMESSPRRSGPGSAQEDDARLLGDDEQECNPVVRHMHTSWRGSAAEELADAGEGATLLSSGSDVSPMPLVFAAWQASFYWHKPAAGHPALRDVTFSVPKGARVVVTGPSGSGKSTLMAGVLGECFCSGQLERPCRFSYAPQHPVLCARSVRENILMDRPLDSDRYHLVLGACELLQDLLTFPDGDRTLVTANGDSLSGGQQARVALARALYGRADLYLLDDPTAALDDASATAVLQRAVFGPLLAGSAVVLATSDPRVDVRQAEFEIVLAEGRVASMCSRQPRVSSVHYPATQSSYDTHNSIRGSSGSVDSSEDIDASLSSTYSGAFRELMVTAFDRDLAPLNHSAHGSTSTALDALLPASPDAWKESWIPTANSVFGYADVQALASNDALLQPPAATTGNGRSSPDNAVPLAHRYNTSEPCLLSAGARDSSSAVVLGSRRNISTKSEGDHVLLRAGVMSTGVESWAESDLPVSVGASPLHSMAVPGDDESKGRSHSVNHARLRSSPRNAINLLQGVNGEAEELREVGHVKLRVYWSYFRAVGWIWVIAVLSTLALMQMLRSGTDIYVTLWSTHTPHSADAPSCTSSAASSRLPSLLHPLCEGSAAICAHHHLPAALMTRAPSGNHSLLGQGKAVASNASSPWTEQALRAGLASWQGASSMRADDVRTKIKQEGTLLPRRQAHQRMLLSALNTPLALDRQSSQTDGLSSAEQVPASVTNPKPLPAAVLPPPAPPISGQAQQRLAAARWADADAKAFLKGLGILFGLSIVATVLRALSFAYAGLEGARHIHTSLLSTVLSAHLSILSQVQPGRLQARFASDTATIDDSLPFIMNLCLANAASLAAAAAIILYSQPLLTALIALLIYVYLRLQSYYRCASRELRRLENVSIAPVYSQVSEGINCAAVVRALNLNGAMMRRFHDALAVNTSARLASRALGQWLSMRLQLISAGLIGMLLVLVVSERYLSSWSAIPWLSRSAAVTLTGLSVAYALPIVSLLNGLLTTGAETEQEMVSMERVLQIHDLLASSTLCTQSSLPGGVPLPSDSSLRFDGITLLYPGRSFPALSAVTFTVAPGEHVGVCGPSGSGKSSLFNALFQLAPLQRGRIELGGINVAKLSPRQLRCLVSVVPQKPVKFHESVAFNLDPDGTCSPAQLLEALRDVNLIPVLRRLRDRSFATADPSAPQPAARHSNSALETVMSGQVKDDFSPASAPLLPPTPPDFDSDPDLELLSLRLESGSCSLSTSQAQQLAVARALLPGERRKRVICLDEIGAHLPRPEREALERAIVTRLMGMTVLRISHCVDTLLACNRIVVLEAGTLCEIGKPQALWDDPGSSFRTSYG